MKGNWTGTFYKRNKINRENQSDRQNQSDRHILKTIIVICSFNVISIKFNMTKLYSNTSALLSGCFFFSIDLLAS